jgi:two-component system sensor histidine kinase VanS
MTWRCAIVRSDEIGVLAESLNTLAQNLDTALRDLKSANNKLQEDIERERKQEKKRRDFFAAVSHELKTPITIIKGELEGMIQNIGIYKNRDQYLRHSLKTAMTMEKLVQEILSVTKMEVDGFTLDLKEVDLSRLVDTCCRQIAGIAEDKSIKVDTSIEKNVMIHADKKLLSKAFSNVMNNAVFHSPVGALIQMKLSELKKTIILSVENSGVHIGQDDMDQLFTPFYRTDKSHNRQSGGSGLGLYITKTILDLHKAMYKIENTENGVKFTICFRRP